MPGRMRVYCWALLGWTMLFGGFLVVSPIGAPSGAFAADDTAAFLTAIDEVPLMAGLTEEQTPALDFDKPDGRLVETYAYGEVTAEEAGAFYRAVMPEFGWQNIDGLVFSREGEMLRIDFIPEERSLVVRFVLSPNSSQ
ncbi:MAG: hypothetical protein O3B21_01490 [Proteobacteria bacterium]|nr:hypothetical protein [Pseudomonadota bacterium]MDA1355650.1 hypothetical protein [Pseudomonadota bacterium]